MGAPKHSAPAKLLLWERLALVCRLCWHPSLLHINLGSRGDKGSSETPSWETQGYCSLRQSGLATQQGVLPELARVPEHAGVPMQSHSDAGDREPC